MEQLWRKTLGDLLDEMAERFPNHDAVIYTDRPFRKSYKEFRDLCDVVARGLLAMGIKKGDHVAMWATNYPEWILTMFATAKIGAVLVTVNTNYKVFELQYLLQQSDAKALVMIDGFKDSNYVNIIQELCPELAQCAPGNLDSETLPVLKSIIHVGEGRIPGMYNWEDIYELANEVPQEELEALQKTVDPDDVVNMQYTSGTTGFPKGVMLTHYNIVNNGKSIGDCMKFTEKDRLCIPVPFFHCFGAVLAIMASVTHGTTMVPVDYYSPKKVMAAISQEKCTAVHGVPTMFIAMLEHPDFEQYDFSSLRTGIMAGSPCPVKVMQQVVDRMNMKDICITYGCTECSPATTMSRTDDSLQLRVETVGKHMPHVETKIVDPETGEECPPGVPGEFISRGYNTMKGYYKMPEATAQVLDKDGWLHSGDIATVDENGYYRITGRIKDMIIRGGENIYPKEIEEFLYTHPAVKDVQVIGVPSEVYGEEVMACIILKEDCAVTEEEIMQFVKGHMARHKTPKYIKFVDSFPMNAAGKILKYKMREQAVEDLKLQTEASMETV